MHIDTDQILRLRRAMQSNEWFASCSEELQIAMLTLGQSRSLADGELLFAAGEVASGFWCVLAGRVRLNHPSADKDSVLLDYTPYDWTGELTLIDDLPDGVNAIAVGETSVVEIKRKVLLDWLAEHPVYWRDFGRLICRRFRYGALMLHHATSLALQERIMQRLYLISAAYGMRSRLTSRIDCSHEELASMIGASRPGVSAALSQLAVKGMVALRYNEIHLLKPQEPPRNWDASDPAVSV